MQEQKSCARCSVMMKELIKMISDDFYTNSIICGLGKNARWTISTLEECDTSYNTRLPAKAPIDLLHLIQCNKIRGWKPGEKLMNLYDIRDAFATQNQLPPNATYYLDCKRDDYVLLDIESKCPDDKKSELLQLPYVYGETSVSDKGLHLILPLPTEYHGSIAERKKKMQEEHGWYEILMSEHNVIMTGKMIQSATGNADFSVVFRELLSKQRDNTKSATKANVHSDKPYNIPREDEIMSVLMNATYAKEPSDFHNDLSRYEYGCTSSMYYIFRQTSYALGTQYTDDEASWCVSEAVRDKIDYRAKHDEERDGLPWLRYLAREVICDSDEFVPHYSKIDTIPIKYEDRALSYLSKQPYTKTPNDFDNLDIFDFALLMHMYKSLITWSKASMLNYTDDEFALLIYRHVSNVTHRDVHDTKQDGLPYLLSIAKKVVTMRNKKK